MQLIARSVPRDQSKTFSLAPRQTRWLTVHQLEPFHQSKAGLAARSPQSCGCFAPFAAHETPARSHDIIFRWCNNFPKQSPAIVVENQTAGVRSCGDVCSTQFADRCAAPSRSGCAGDMLRGRLRGKATKSLALRRGGLRHRRGDLDRIGIAAQHQACHPTHPQLRAAVIGHAKRCIWPKGGVVFTSPGEKRGEGEPQSLIPHRIERRPHRQRVRRLRHPGYLGGDTEQAAVVVIHPVEVQPDDRLRE